MTDEFAFLAAVLADPDADEPRLVYADWLEERGDPRGEFIRVQCELAAIGNLQTGMHPVNDGPPVGASDVIAASMPYRTYRLVDATTLRRRERELLAAHVDSWFADLRWAGFTFLTQTPKSFSPEDAPFAIITRGFVSAVCLPVDGWIGSPCGRCEGAGGQQTYTGHGNVESESCTDCDGTGHTDPLGPWLVRSCPLWPLGEAVRFSGVWPAQTVIEETGEPAWALWRPGYGGARSFLTPEIWEALMPPGGCYAVPWERITSATYPTEAAALSALSSAAISWALAQPVPELAR